MGRFFGYPWNSETFCMCTSVILSVALIGAILMICAQPHNISEPVFIVGIAIICAAGALAFAIIGFYVSQHVAEWRHPPVVIHNSHASNA